MEKNEILRSKKLYLCICKGNIPELSSSHCLMTAATEFFKNNLNIYTVKRTSAY